MQLKKVLDSNILIYSLLEGHPASKVCEELILSCENKFDWVTSPITFYETFHILIRIYGQEISQVFDKIKTAMKLPIEIIPLDESFIVSSLENSIIYSINTNDSILLQISINYGIPIIATDDKKLINACKQNGIICENPIIKNIRSKMSEWEDKNLPEKGLKRIYSNLYKWIFQKDKKIAEEFKSETREFTKPI